MTSRSEHEWEDAVLLGDAVCKHCGTRYEHLPGGRGRYHFVDHKGHQWTHSKSRGDLPCPPTSQAPKTPHS